MRKTFAKSHAAGKDFFVKLVRELPAADGPVKKE
jgi:hypothetical protein